MRTKSGLIFPLFQEDFSRPEQNGLQKEFTSKSRMNRIKWVHLEIIDSDLDLFSSRFTAMAVEIMLSLPIYLDTCLHCFFYSKPRFLTADLLVEQKAIAREDQISCFRLPALLTSFQSRAHLVAYSFHLNVWTTNSKEKRVGDAVTWTALTINVFGREKRETGSATLLLHRLQPKDCIHQLLQSLPRFIDAHLIDQKAEQEAQVHLNPHCRSWIACLLQQMIPQLQLRIQLPLSQRLPMLTLSSWVSIPISGY